MPKTTLIHHCHIVKDAAQLQRNGYVLIEGRQICGTGPMSALPDVHADVTIDGTNTVAIPGLINAHNHSPMTLFRGMADDLELHDWLHNHIFPAEAAYVSPEMVYWCSKLAAAEMVLSGTTCVADGYFFPEQTAAAFEEAGLRAVVAHGILDFPAPGVPDPSRNIAVVETFLQKWRNRSTLITPGVFAHSPYTCSPDTLQRAKKLADRYDVPFFVHLAESAGEQQMIISPAGSSPLRHLHALGILDPNCVLVHAIWLDDEDLDILAATGAHVVLCPQSNCKLASGRSRAVDMVKRGLSPGLGTDGCAGNNSMDMFREMDFFAKSQKVQHHDPTIFTAEDVFSMATEGNNKILGYDSPVAIQSGNNADIVLIDLQAPHLTPFYNQDLLVYSARGSDVATVIIDGELIVRERMIQSYDLKETQRRVMQLALPLQASPQKSIPEGK
jgi:5-methylthioadenosine/S-adenosylhomocysteine deaminase